MLRMKSALRDKWHLLIVLIGLLLLSALSVANSVQKIADWAQEDDADPATAVELAETGFDSGDSLPETVTDEAEGENRRQNSLAGSFNVSNKIDGAVNHVNRLWERSIYKKAKWSRIDSVYTYCATGEIASVQVICGSDGWLFYKSGNGGDTVADYEGKNYYSEEELKRFLQPVFKTQEMLEKREIQFALMVSPNKESIYSDYMPKQYHHEPVSRTDLLLKYLEDNDIHAVSPKESLLDSKSEYQLYYPNDSHWNQLGAYIGVKDILSLWNIELPELSERTVISFELKGNYHEGANDDLARMAGLIAFVDHEMEYQVEGTIQPDWEAFGAEQTQGVLSHFINDTADIQKTLFLIGDSFRFSMVPVLSKVFRDVYVIHRDSYMPEMLDTVQPDFLISEYVERFSEEIANADFL